MKLTFIHDGPVFRNEKGEHFEFAYHGLYERYGYMADEIRFLMRVNPFEPLRRYTRVPDEVQVISVPNFKSPKMLLKEYRNASRIVREAVRESDIVVCRTQSSIAHMAIACAKKYKIPYIVECVGCSWDAFWNFGSLLGKLMAPFEFLMTRYEIRNAPFVYYVTKEFLQKRYPSRGVAVSCSNVLLRSLDDKVLEARLERIRGRQRGDVLVLATAGAIDTRYKGQEYVIRAIPELVRRGYNVEYRLAGGMSGQKGNTFLHDLAKQCGVESRVVFLGALNIDEMNAFYDGVDIYIQPSKQEGLPRAVVEAMSHACPCIGTKVGGVPELIQTDLIISKGSSKAVVDGIENILSRDLAKIARENLETARGYEVDKLRAIRERFYDQFLGEYGISPKTKETQRCLS